MPVNYAGLQATATRLIGENGLSATLRQSGVTGGDPWNPTPGADTDTAVTVVDLGRVQEFGPAAGGGAMSVVNSDRRVLMRVSEGVTPTAGDRLQIGSEWLTVTAVNTVSPGGTVIMFEVDLSA